ncbi:MAG: proton-conducting membrane transporter [Oscillospiraceae bacterium]|nr:proton-conducting membrane transporter [Oscillospiraceae bacterium]
MSQYWILAAILLPILGSLLIPLLPFPKKQGMHLYIEAVVLITSAIVWLLLLGGTTRTFEVVHFVNDLSISFRIDGMTMVFAGLVAVLWPLATLYAFEYMDHAEHVKAFFMFYVMTYGVTLGIAFASDMMTMYFFYELLTLVTVPLVMHSLNRESILAVRKYLYYSIGGAAFALMGMIFLMVYGNTCEFTMGGVMNAAALQEHRDLLLWIYFFSFMGFGVKAAVWPVSSWLPQAGVAPTPVTALLHAVAVVNAGAFAIIRLTYYSFGTDFLRGTWVQNICMAITMFTIVYGCSRAVKETHIKRRLAWSTVSNLSYILFGATIMTPLGLVGALSHFVFHGFMKICSFLCAGAFMHQTGKTQVYHMSGMGKRMKIVFGCFTVSALGLMGVPGLAGFISKWNLTAAAVESGNLLAYGGIACLLLSALLTAIYMLSVSIRAYFPKAQSDADEEMAGDPSWRMCLPLLLCAFCVILLGFCSEPLISFFRAVALGME